mmetsp:Transcript_29340/g.39866  ORF Transcript_29340/g.39866 Transcript_29340/m.39866 type:complete len:204 (+) Transcript_29340:812-1423(+)
MAIDPRRNARVHFRDSRMARSACLCALMSLPVGLMCRMYRTSSTWTFPSRRKTLTHTCTALGELVEQGTSASQLHFTYLALLLRLVMDRSGVSSTTSSKRQPNHYLLGFYKYKKPTHQMPGRTEEEEMVVGGAPTKARGRVLSPTADPTHNSQINGQRPSQNSGEGRASGPGGMNKQVTARDRWINTRPRQPRLKCRRFKWPR